jgi:UDP-N-acetylglucosamine 2-epimerase (non-hydrolysing)
VTGSALPTVLVVMGTRPEAIKLAPVVAELRRHPDLQTKVCVTGQHREMLEPLLSYFDVRPDTNLAVMTADQSLSSLTARALERIDGLIQTTSPDWLVVQGDTTSAMAASLAAFYRGVAVAHVEAGLRTHDLRRPFPEEANRRITDVVATAYFAPTELARRNLLGEGVDHRAIHVTGNTVVDALLDVASRPYCGEDPLASMAGRRVVLVTAHRRESLGPKIRDVCIAIRRLADTFTDIGILFPVHMNPHVQAPVRELLSGHPRITLTAPLDYVSLVHVMRRSDLILTDSGGIQEEAPSFGKPVLVLRDITERPEAVDAGCARIVGTDPQRIFDAAAELLTDPAAYARMAPRSNPFGDGRASERIVRILRQSLARSAVSPEPLVASR